MFASYRSILPYAAAAALALPATTVSAKTSPHHITGTEVTFKRAKEKRQHEIGDALRTASSEEAKYYDPALPPAVIRIQIEKTGSKSTEKAVLGAIPLVGMFAGENRNMMKGRVEVVDTATGKVVAKYKIECDDDTQMSLGDMAVTYGKVGLMFLPFGELISTAVDVAEGATNRRDRAEEMLTRGFIMLSYKKVYGDKLYKSFAQSRKTAFDNRKAATAAAARSAVPGRADDSSRVAVSQPAAPADASGVRATPPAGPIGS